ncbi:MAG: CHASE2 domain-containing protein [Planctomycetes bacterium]|nr:CHASE2 domain-containing protein [Planctomycetota bacterium]
MSGSPRESPTAYLQDRPVLSRPRAWVLIVLGALIAASAAWVLSGQYWTDRLEGVTIDWRFQARGPRSSNSKIVIVEIDAESHRRLKHDGLAFNLREHLAPAINRLADAGALVVGLDTWLEDRTSPEIDGPLAAAIESTNVVLGTVYTEQGVNRASEELRAAMPVEGLISVELDAGDNVLRRTPPRLYLDLLSDDGLKVQARLPHFPLAVALFSILEKDETAVIEFNGPHAKIGNHTLRAGELVDYVAVKRGMREGGFRWPAMSLADVVEGKFDAKAVDGAIVLIGESRMVQDSFLTPLSKEITPGVYYHSNVAAQILDDRHFDETWSQPANASWVAAGCALMAGVFAMMPLARRWRGRRWRVELQHAVLGIAVFPGGWTLACFWAFDRGVVLPLAAPLAGMGVALAMGYAAQWIKVSIEARRLGERARHIERLFSLSVSSSVLEAIKSNRSAWPRPRFAM